VGVIFRDDLSEPAQSKCSTYLKSALRLTVVSRGYESYIRAKEPIVAAAGNLNRLQIRNKFNAHPSCTHRCTFSEASTLTATLERNNRLFIHVIHIMYTLLLDRF
jgi:hypothetical protein